MAEKFVVVGKVISPHGVKGELRVKVLTEVPERFEQGAEVYMTVAGTRKVFIVEASRGSKGSSVVKFESIDTIEQAEAVNKSLIEIREEDLMVLPKGSYWRHQIVGLQVFTRAGKFLGEITEIMETGVNDVYVVKSGEKEVLIPALYEVIKEVNLADKKMIIEPLPGLIE